jgi:hypothetical protein
MESQGHYNPDGSWTSEYYLFRNLTAAEVEAFREHARGMKAPEPAAQTIMHPVCREVWQGNVKASAPATWIDPEEKAYPAGGFTRKGRVRLERNPHNSIALPYGEVRAVRLSIPDTFFTIPARFVYKGKTIRGYVSRDDGDFTFTPEASKGKEHHANGACCNG